MTYQWSSTSSCPTNLHVLLNSVELCHQTLAENPDQSSRQGCLFLQLQKAKWPFYGVTCSTPTLSWCAEQRLRTTSLNLLSTLTLIQVRMMSQICCKGILLTHVQFVAHQNPRLFSNKADFYLVGRSNSMELFGSICRTLHLPLLNYIRF